MARIRERRLSLRPAAVRILEPPPKEEEDEVRDPSSDEGARESEVAILVEDDCWARMAPALRSSSRRWPLARRGDILETEVHMVIGARGSSEMKVDGEVEVEVGFLEV